MNSLRITAWLLIFSAAHTYGQHGETRNVILVTLDGFRWQEVFSGADPSIFSNDAYVDNREEIAGFIRPTKAESRAALMPFLWEVVARQGQLYGNRDLKNRVNCTNHRLISYPGYSEMLVGFSHRKVTSNRKKNNPHATVFEFIERQPEFRNEVAAFATWDAFPYIFRESTSSIHVNAGNALARGNISRTERLLNEIQKKQARSDSITFQYAMAYLVRERPRVTFIGFDGTDHYGHLGRYDEYLHAAHQADRMIAALWRWVQSQPDYRNRTTLFITTDHGRGKGKRNWRKHRLLTAGSRHIWFAVVGPDTPALGVISDRGTTYQNQVASTLAAFLGLDYHNRKPVGEVVHTMISTQHDSEELVYSRDRAVPFR